MAIDARHTYALAKNAVLPRYFVGVEPRSGIPRRAIMLNLVVILALLLPFSGWQDVVSLVGDLLTYAAVAVWGAPFAQAGTRRSAGWVPEVRYLAPVSFVVATEFSYWWGWTHLRIALPLTLVGVPLFVLAWRRARVEPLGVELRRGAWVVGYLLALILLSRLGSLGGTGAIDALDELAEGVGQRVDART